MRELKSVFEGAWEYSYAGLETYTLTSPVFTQSGDLIVQLRGFTENSTTKTSTFRTPSLTPSKNNGAIGSYASLIEPPFFKRNGVVKISSASAPLMTALAVDAEDEPLIANGSSQYKMSDSFLTTSSAIDTPLLTPPAVEAEHEPLMADGSEQHPMDDSFLTAKMELPKLAPPVLQTDTEPDLTLAGF
ncbi:hypothetical protein B0H19DRAFT_1091017 [Mycena capillaripes]|nr:hypothetical protein B0H19DRAFT_1091017 [Mycena capillaripes]